MKQVIQFTENEGDPFLATVNGTFIVVGTTQGVVKVYDLSRRFYKNTICKEFIIGTGLNCV